ncbi:small subunit ribosomal protein S1 [Xanthobacter flavus]|uniref:30S ribosomal protein S1 n=1 Tax=Xanthobacter flavus TaxID=281 RepID=A0A9W6FP24_XANFL|nr:MULTISPECIES: 30S ribosomal protein S1 [Xanthobacter]MDR6335748.1 small subunit ribosomal protein S1 [Xanthobacter flavus]NMN59866.1 small subunit ribosomal protein S1 [Xanthobacter sp. SG618]UDQ90806.1 30S ribosomal protein S1 [Xanthobacter autotrophicus]GLI24573.1 30S ribosomal protein S1 [Xanthobacter flavus]
MSAVETTREDFAALLDESFGRADTNEGSVVKGIVVAIEKDLAIIDIGLKTEGRVALREFAGPGRENAIKVGDEVEVYLERVENAMGEAVLSRDKARREESWVKLEKAFTANEKVFGVIFNQVKGGFTVDLDGAVAFLPRSQVDIRPIRDVGPLMHNQQPFQILKMDRRRGNIVVSRRTVLEETRAEQRHELVQNLEEGQAIDGVVKNITDYGAFVDLGGIDGLLHVTDIAWRRVNHPTEVLNIGQTVKVKIIKINHETHRISLGMKQLLGDPWEGIEAKYPVEARFKGRVTNITDYGAFVELEPGIEGLIHVSEMSWTKKNVHPGKIVSTSQEVEVQVLEVDSAKRRISLGLKQTLQNPWEAFAEKYAPGAVVEGEVKNKTEFGLFLGLDGDVDGMVHLSDLDWNRPGEQVIDEYRKGDMVKAVVLDVDVEKERISLGIKQLAGDPFADAGEVKKGAVVTCEVTDVKDGGIEVKLTGTDLSAFIKRSELARDRNDQRPERFSVGDKLDARVTLFDRKARKVQVSIKAMEIAEEREAVAQFGSQDSGASLGDILGAALKQRAADAADEADKED